MAQADENTTSDTVSEVPFAVPISGSASVIDVDLYCLVCGYNLRGLSGDPVRCPECGDFNDRTELGIPQPVIKAALNQMETTPTVCVGCALLFLLFASIAALTSSALTSTRLHHRVPLSSAVLSLVFLVAWPIAKNRVRRSFNDQDDWRPMLAEFHTAGVLGVMWYPLLLGFALVADRLPATVRSVVGCLTAAGGIALFVVALRIYRTARGRILVMKRATAIRIAQEILGTATFTKRRT